MKVLITGGAGFIGSHVVESCLAEGFKVVLLDNLSRGKRGNVPDGIRLHEIDITGAEVASVFEAERPEVVVHLAAQVDVAVSVANPIFDAGVNIMGTLNVLEACRATGVKKIVYACSAAIYGDPAYIPVDEAHPVAPQAGYGASKYVPELYLKLYRDLYGLDFTVLRYANVYGPRQDATGEGGVVAIFVDRLSRGESPLIYGDGEQTRDFVYVKDVARANVLAVERGNGEVLNISTGTSVSINELFARLKELVGSRIEPRYAPARPGDIRHSSLDNRRAHELLSWEAEYSLADGLAETVAWARKSTTV